MQNVGASAGSTNYPDNRRAEHSNCVTFDQRHVFNLSAVFQTPKFSSQALRLIAGDWQISPIMKIKSGQFITVTGGVDYALNGAPQATLQRPNQVLASPYASEKTVDHWLNPAAFAAPAPGTYGNLGANNVAGPGNVPTGPGRVANVLSRGGQDPSASGRSLQSSKSNECEQSSVDTEQHRELRQDSERHQRDQRTIRG